MPDAAELHRRARKMLPRGVYDYYAGGAGRERTLRANEKAWRQVWLAPRVLRDVSSVDTSVRLLGTAFSTPLCVAPTGYQRLAHPDGELATAEGAARAGALFVLSTRSTCRIEDVAEVVAKHAGTWWFQVYLMRDRYLTESLVRRAAAAGAAALVLTADTPVVGRKRRDSADGVASDEDFLVNLGPLDDLKAAEQSAGCTFADVGWLSHVGGGLPVVVKGVLRGDDADACRAHGAAAVIVSNHGGRQLDGALPSALALPGVAGALRHGAGEAGAAGGGDAGAAGGGEAGAAGGGADGTGGDAGAAGGGAGGCEVYADGGIRTGEDALAALALGARAVFLGRPVMWALTCGGADGVRSLLAGLTDDLAHAMALAGAATVADAGGIALVRCAARPPW
jgi:4-hydroxymandelate oxidase